MSHELVPSVSIDNLLQQRDAMAERARAACERLREVNDLAKAAFADMSESWYGGSLDLYRHYGRYDGSVHEFTDERGIAEFVKTIDTQFWSYLFEKSGLRTFMDAAARKTWDDAITKRDVPPLTRENIAATFAAMHDQRGEMFERGVVDIFRKLSWDYKTNNPVMFGKRVVIRYMVDGLLGGVSYEGCNKLDDLVRVFSVLDGKPEPDHRAHTHRQLRELRWPEAHTATLDYFSLRGFKNGNAHLTFTRTDLVDKMNLIIAKHYPGALPFARDAAA